MTRLPCHLGHEEALVGLPVGRDEEVLEQVLAHEDLGGQAQGPGFPVDGEPRLDERRLQGGARLGFGIPEGRRILLKAQT